MSQLKIIWSTPAKKSLRDIFDYYKTKSVQGAKNVRTDLVQAPKTIRFAEQYQQDDINPKYRRIVVRDFKVLYLEKDEAIHIIDIISGRQSPETLKGK